MWPFKKKSFIKKEIPFSYFSLINSIVDIAKKNKKQYKFVDLNKYVYLTYCLYSGKYHQNLLNEDFYMYMPNIPLTKSIYKFYCLNKIGLEENIKSHINKELIDENSEEYKKIEEIYNYLKQYKSDDIISLISFVQLENNIKCPIKQIMYDIACEEYYTIEFKNDINVYETIKKKCSKIKFNDIELFYSNFIDENGNFIKMELKYETKN